jgi:hypothetical protein
MKSSLEQPSGHLDQSLATTCIILLHNHLR